MPPTVFLPTTTCLRHVFTPCVYSSLIPSCLLSRSLVPETDMDQTKCPGNNAMTSSPILPVLVSLISLWAWHYLQTRVFHAGHITSGSAIPLQQQVVYIPIHFKGREQSAIRVKTSNIAFRIIPG